MPSPAGAPGDPTASALPSVVAVVVNWNGAACLGECVESLRRQTYRGELRIVVVDNGSTDGSDEVLRGLELEPRVTVVRNPRNRGFAAATNQGIAAAASDLVALLNNDAVADPRWLEELVAALQQSPDAGSCACRVLSYFDRRVVDNAGHVVYWDGLTRGRGRNQADTGQFDAREEVFCASGSACLLRRAMLDDVGLFDEDFFAYCEDADLGFRARLRGWRCLYVPGAVARHRFSASTGAYSPLKAVWVERNRLWLALKNLPLPLLLVGPACTAWRYFWQAWGVVVGRGASGRFASERSALELPRLLLRAYAEAAAGLPRALRQRRIIQARKRASALDVWRWLRRFGIGARAMAFMD
jgi:GT2 family glycosyltransferase